MSAMARVMRPLEPMALLALPAFMMLWAWLELSNAALVTSAAAVLAFVPFFVSFEAGSRRARDIMPIIIMTALAVAGRLLFAPVPSVKPIYAIVIMAGLCFGREEGFLTGSLSMLVSNIFFGQGPWTLWQMFGMGLIGYLAAVAGERGLLTCRWKIAVFGFAMVLLYGFIMDTWTLIGFVADMSAGSALMTYAMGAARTMTAAVATVIFLGPIAETWPRMFRRIKEKYQIGTASVAA